MHGTLVALVLTAYLLASSGVFARLWNLPPEPSAPQTLEKEGPGLDPNGITVTVPPAEAGPGLDPDGRS